MAEVEMTNHELFRTVIEMINAVKSSAAGLNFDDGDLGFVEYFKDSIESLKNVEMINGQTAKSFLSMFIGALVVPQQISLEKLSSEGVELDVQASLEKFVDNNITLSSLVESMNSYGD